MAFRKWQPSRKAKREFAQKMQEIHDFCTANNISESSTNDSYYFSLNDIDYRISNHSVERSVYKDDFGNYYHYHGDSKDYRKGTFCIHASKTRIIEIYTNLKNGYELDHFGNIKD